MKERHHIKGFFTLRAFNKAGELVEEYEAENLVVNTGRSGAAQLLGGAVTGKRVTQIAFGTGSAAPSPTDVDLTDKTIKAVDSVAYPQVGAVEFSWSLDFLEANGKDLYEFGLFNVDNELFSRKTRSLISKTSDIRLEGTWTIQY